MTRELPNEILNAAVTLEDGEVLTFVKTEYMEDCKECRGCICFECEGCYDWDYECRVHSDCELCESAEKRIPLNDCDRFSYLMECEEGGCICLQCAGSLPKGFCNMEQCDTWCKPIKYPWKACGKFLPRTKKD
ncbi:hypothetical protein AGMMS49975_24350 [Clostridia bacterium]|nr:hypothetical protein AGMMS49975_24350 [Clostridia bacterium]